MAELGSMFTNKWSMDMKDKNFAVIFARGGSKGLPDKNIKLFGDKPLIAWSIESALALESIESVYVSTDSKKIAKIAEQYGAKVPFIRPKDLASDESPEWLSWKHAIEFYKEKNQGNLPNKIISIPTTAPLRDSSDIQKCINEYEKGNVDVVVTSTESLRSPYFNMVVERENGYVKLPMKDYIGISRRQDSPKMYDITTVAYVADPKFVLSSNGIFDGRVRQVIIPRERAIDIDTLIDFKFAESLIQI
jgi:CMP-N-acetylneuraminic acid synthetase